jgi:hypothetical protein
MLVMDRIQPEHLRFTSRRRLAVLDGSLSGIEAREARLLHERLQVLPPIQPVIEP